MVKGLSGWRSSLFSLRRHSSESWNPGGRCRGVKEWQVLWDGALDCRSCDCHSRLRGNGLHKPLDSGLRRNDGGWIPAFTRRSRRAMTECLLRRHSSESWNPGRRCRGAKGWQVLSDGTLGCHACDCHSRSSGNVLNQPLDSSAFVPDTALPPRRLVPDAALPPTSL